MPPCPCLYVHFACRSILPLACFAHWPPLILFSMLCVAPTKIRIWSRRRSYPLQPKPFSSWLDSGFPLISVVKFAKYVSRCREFWDSRPLPCSKWHGVLPSAKTPKWWRVFCAWSCAGCGWRQAFRCSVKRTLRKSGMSKPMVQLLSWVFRPSKRWWIFPMRTMAMWCFWAMRAKKCAFSNNQGSLCLRARARHCGFSPALAFATMDTHDATNEMWTTKVATWLPPLPPYLRLYRYQVGPNLREKKRTTWNEQYKSDSSVWQGILNDLRNDSRHVCV